jgi:uncharacterized MnhB-related membrane protein
MSLHVVLFISLIVCAVLAVRSRPLVAALWLAGLSALSAIVLYVYGAAEVGAIELSVGAGLITVLLAFAISMAEDESMPPSIVPRPFAWLLVFVACGLLAWLILPQLPTVHAVAAAEAPFFIQVWENRLLDLMVQIAIIISGVIGVLSLLGETGAAADIASEVSR